MPARATANVARKIFLIATEESGDRLGASLMKVLRQRLGDAVRFEGVGGQSMAREGLASLFPIEELSIMGLAAVVKQLPKILRLIRETADAVTAGRARHSRDHRQSRFHPSGGAARPRPRSLDPDRRLRLALGLGVAAGPGARDAALCRSRAGAAAVRAGGVSQAARAALQLCRPSPDRADRHAAARMPTSRQRRDEPPPVLLVLPGSRRSEIRHHMAVFGETLGRLQARGRAVRSWSFRPCRICRMRSARASKSWPVQPRIVVGEQEKRAAFRIAHAALAKSGTVTLELALAGVPMVAAYRVGAVEAWIAAARDPRAVGHSGQSRDRRERRAGIPPGGLHAGETGAGAARHARRIRRCGGGRSKPLRRLDAIMSTGDQPPSVRAADIVLATMRKSRRVELDVR